MMMMTSVSRTRAGICIRASATSTPSPKTLKALNITKSSLINSQDGRATRNIDGTIYTVEANELGEITIVDRVNRLQYDAVVGEKDNRISMIVESARTYGGNLGGGLSFDQLRLLLALSSPEGQSNAEILNCRVAMAAFLGVVGTYYVTGNTFAQQLTSEIGLIAAGALGMSILVASIAPAIVGKTSVEKVFPSENDSFADRQLPYFWTALAEIINGRVAMIGLTGILLNNIFRGSMFF